MRILLILFAAISLLNCHKPCTNCNPQEMDAVHADAVADSELAASATTEPVVANREADPLAGLVSSDAQVRIEAIEALAIGVPSDALPALRDALFDTDWAVREAAIDTLGNYRTDDAAFLLALMLSESDEDLCIDAVDALHDNGTPTARAYIEQALSHDSAPVREVAVASLAEFRSRPLVGKTQSNDPVH